MIHVILTCTASKTLPVPNELMFRNFSGATQRELFDEWVVNVEQHQKIPAIDLYGGQLQQFYKDAPNVTLWIASAGMGLISPTTPIPPYNITFNHRWEDGIRRNFLAKIAEKNWWEMLCAYNKFSIADLVAKHPRDTFILSTSEAYHPALMSDICAASYLTDNAVFISRWLGGDFNGIKMPTDKRIIPLIGATEYNISTKYALYCVTQLLKGCTWQEISEGVQRYIDGVPKITRERTARSKIGDDGVKMYLNLYGGKTIPQITNIIRNDGYSCGSDRFNKIARQVGYIK